MRAWLPALIVLAACSGAPSGPREDPLAADWYPELTRYGMVRIEGGKMIAADDVLPYEVNTPLFTDYAAKLRTVWIPPGGQATYREDGTFDFPVGTILTKSFGFEQRWIETRLLIRRESGWDGTTYVWDDAQKNALRRPGGTTTTGAKPGELYVVPSSTQCGKCHEQDGAFGPIGLTALQINRDGLLERWAQAGKLAGLSESPPKLPQFTDASLSTETRARAYLHANCAHCHSPRGEARTTGLFLGYGETDPLRLGLCKAPVAAGMASAGLDYDVVPGDPDHSILVYRMQSTTPSVMMPELGRTLPHAEAVSAVSAWIRALPQTPCK